MVRKDSFENHRDMYPSEGEAPSLERDVNFFDVRACGRGVYGDVAAILGAVPRLRVYLSVLGWWGCGVRISGQGPDQTIQESEIYIFVR